MSICFFNFLPSGAKLVRHAPHSEIRYYLTRCAKTEPLNRGSRAKHRDYFVERNDVIKCSEDCRIILSKTTKATQEKKRILCCTVTRMERRRFMSI